MLFVCLDRLVEVYGVKVNLLGKFEFFNLIVSVKDWIGVVMIIVMEEVG